MSAEDLRDMKTMLAQLEADGPFDHTEAGIFAKTDPDGFFGTDFLGYARQKRIDTLETQLAEEKKAKETLQTQLNEEKESHAGTKGETLIIRQQLATQLREMKKNIENKFDEIKSTFRGFQQNLEGDIHTLMIRSEK
jgi:hypothetical protein